MNDVETRLRATLQAVAEATGSEHISSYVETPARKQRRPLVLLATAAAVVAVVGAAVTLRPGADYEQVRPGFQPGPAAPATPAAPEGGRLLLEGTVGSERWALYGAERLPGFEAAPPGDQTPCFALPVSNREHTPRGCGFGGRPGGTTSFQQLGPAVASGDQVLLLGVLDFEVDHVTIQLQTTKQQFTVTPVADPAHPDGARYFVMVIPVSEGHVQLKLNTPTGTVLHVSDIRVDGPVGG